MGLVSLACTLLVVAIILIAVALSSRGGAAARSRHSGVGPELVHLVPQPRRFHNRTPTIVVHRRSPKIWRRHADDLTTLLRAYRERQAAAATNCDLHYAPIGISSCSFPLERISENCSTPNHFGYDSGNPCVALIFNSFAGWTPQPDHHNRTADATPAEQHPELLRLACNATAPTDVRYSPFPGFPVRLVSGQASGLLPPLVMVQFLVGGISADVEVACTLRARNLPGDGTIRFSLFIV